MRAKKFRASQSPSRRSNKTGGTAQVVVENVNHPGKSRAVDAPDYQAMRRTLLKVLPSRSPGFTLAELLRMCCLSYRPTSSQVEPKPAGG